jgi:hypothetical protein
LYKPTYFLSNLQKKYNLKLQFEPLQTQRLRGPCFPGTGLRRNGGKIASLNSRPIQTERKAFVAGERDADGR